MRNSINISLPTSMKTWVHRQSKRDGFGTVSEFVRDLLRKEQERKDRSQIEKQLLAALDSGPATPWTDGDWQELQNIIDKKRSQTAKQSHVKNGRHKAGTL